MPPKADPKKGAEATNFADIDTLPSVRTCNIQLHFSKFKTMETRHKVQEHVKANLPENVKTIDREAIKTYGTANGIIDADAGPGQPPKEEGGLTYEQMLARSAYDRLYELEITQRREKQNRVEGGRTSGSDAPRDSAMKIETAGTEQIDYIVYLPDYPSTAEEALALSQYNQCVHCLFDVYQVQETAEGAVPIDLKAAKEVDPSTEDDSAEHAATTASYISNLKSAIARSAKNAPIRHTAVFRVPFCDVDPPVITQEEGAEPTTNLMPSEQNFMKTFQSESLENATQLYLNYLLFKELVNLHSLMPDKAVMSELRELKQARQQYMMAQQEQQLQLQELQAQAASASQKELMTEEQLAEYEAQVTEQKTTLEAELAQATEAIEANQARINELVREATRSLDDENKHRKGYFQSRVYKNSFLPAKESANCVSSIVSAMVSQIAEEREDDASVSDRDNVSSTEPETLDDLFDQFEEQIAYDTNLKERFPEDEEFEQASLKGKLGHQFQVFETYDTSSIPLQTLPAGVVDDYKSLANTVAERQKAAAQHAMLPGLERHMMPPVPQKSKRLRDQENPQFYPFSTLPIEDSERMLQLREFAQLMKQNGVFENQTGKDKMSKNKVFERNYDEYLAPTNLRQVLQDSLLMDPDVATSYYPRSDQLLVLLYNKVNGSKRSSDKTDKPHGIRKWKATDRTMPNFQGFIENFAPGCIMQDPNYVPENDTSAAQKLILDHEQLPGDLLDVDSLRVAEISQNINQYFPDDNSIMTSEEYEIGGVKRVKSIVHKDKTSFGITVGLNQHLPVESQYGLVSYKPVGDHKLWVNFSDKDSKLFVETVEVCRNKQMMIEVDPPAKTEAELEAEREAAAAAAAAAAKDKKKPADAVVEEKPVEKIWEEAPFNHLDTLFDDAELGAASRGACSTITLKNGLIVRHLADGKIVQIKESSLENTDGQREVDRVYLPRGIVVRHFANHNAEVLHPYGDVAHFDRETLTWTLTNSKGFRRQMKDGHSTDLPPINCLKQSDLSTGTVTNMRADKVLMIEYTNGSTYTQHADGTQIYSEIQNAAVRVEKEGFAPVCYDRTQKCEDLEEWLECDGVKSLTGWVTDVQLPDSSNVKTVQFFKDSERTDHIVTKHVYMREDFSTVIVDSEGDFKVITASARVAINDSDERSRLGQDTDYLKELVTPADTMTPGVYYGCISDVAENNFIRSRDSVKPYSYTINCENKLEKAMYEKFVMNEDWAPVDLGGRCEGEVEPLYCSRNPFAKHFIFPRMFIISPSGEGLELLSQDQVDTFIRNNQYRKDTLTTSRVEPIDTTQLNSINVMNKVTSIQEKELENNQISGRLRLPEYAEPYVIQLRSDEDIKKLKPRQDQYQFRNLTEYASFDQLKQQCFLDDHGRFTEWKMSQVRYDTEFGIVHHAPKDVELNMEEIEDNEYAAAKINSKIYKIRAAAKQPFDRSQFKANFQKVWNTDDMVVQYRKMNTSVGKEEAEMAEMVKIREAKEAEQLKIAEERKAEETAAIKRQNLKQKTRVRVEQRLAAFGEMKETPSFCGSYHKSRAGMDYHAANPVKPPTEEVLMRMSQRINRSQQNSNRDRDQNNGQSIFDGNSHRSAGSAERRAQIGNEREGQPSYARDNPVVALEPEDQYRQGSVDKSKKFTSVSKQTGDQMEMSPEREEAKLSLYMQEKKYLKQLDQEKILKAEEHHVIKTKDFDVYGKLRQDKPYVKSTAKSNMPSELNEKFITTECITDRRIKISSMANRQYIAAPSIEEVRKQGQHQMIMQAIEKKQTFSELINQANSMVTSVLHDNMKRSVNIMPSCAKFGPVMIGADYDMTVTIKNEDSLSQRIHIKPCSDKRLVVKQESYGPIAPGMTRKVIVTISASEVGTIKEEVQIVTKADIFKLKVEAEFVADEQMSATKNSRIKSRLRASIAQANHHSFMDVNEAAEGEMGEGSEAGEIVNDMKSGSHDAPK